MKKNLLGFVTALNTVALVGVVAFTAQEEGSQPATAPPAQSPAPPATVQALQERVAALEERLLGGGVEPATAAPSPKAQPLDAPSTDSPSGATRPGDDQPVTRAEIKDLVQAQLDARQEEAQRKWQQKAKRPKKTLGQVARELEIDPRQEAAIRRLYVDMERQSMITLFGVEADQLEALKAQIAQSEHDPALKAELRERIAVNYTRHGNELSVLWVQLDANLRKVLDSDTLASFYRNDVQLENREFPDITATFFPEKLPKGEDEDED